MLGLLSESLTESEPYIARSNAPTKKRTRTKKNSGDKDDGTMTSQARSTPIHDTTARRALVYVGGVGALLSVVATPLYGIGFSSGIALGAALAAANLWLTARTVSAFLSGHSADGEETGLRASWGIVALLKFSLLLLAVYLIFHFRLVHAFAFIIGLAALPVGMVLLQLAGPAKTAHPSKISDSSTRVPSPKQS